MNPHWHGRVKYCQIFCFFRGTHGNVVALLKLDALEDEGELASLSLGFTLRLDAWLSGVGVVGAAEPGAGSSSGVAGPGAAVLGAGSPLS